MHGTLGDVALTNIGRETDKSFPRLSTVSKFKVLRLSSASDILSMFLNFGHFSAARSYKYFYEESILLSTKIRVADTHFVFCSGMLYILFVILLGAVCTREALVSDYMIASKVRTSLYWIY